MTVHTKTLSERTDEFIREFLLIVGLPENELDVTMHRQLQEAAVRFRESLREN